MSKDAQVWLCMSTDAKVQLRMSKDAYSSLTVQSNLSNTDTEGTEPSVRIRQVSVVQYNTIQYILN